MWQRLADWAVPSDSVRLRPSLADRLAAISWHGQRARVQIGTLLRDPVQRIAALIADALRQQDADALRRALAEGDLQR